MTIKNKKGGENFMENFMDEIEVKNLNETDDSSSAIEEFTFNFECAISSMPLAERT